jgi:hypothetical protein
MGIYGSDENGLNWDDGHIPYHKLFTVLSEAVANFAHLYSIGITKCKLPSDLRLPIHDLQDFNCPHPSSFKPKFICSLPCHRFTVSCSTKIAHYLYIWLKYHLQTKYYVKCPKDMSRHTSEFISAIKNRYGLLHNMIGRKKYPTSFYAKLTFCSSCIKTVEAQAVAHHTLAIASRRRNSNVATATPTEYDTCNFYAVEEVSPVFYPNRVLLRRVFFIDEYNQIRLGRILSRSRLPNLGGIRTRQERKTDHPRPQRYARQDADSCPEYASPCAEARITYSD